MNQDYKNIISKYSWRAFWISLVLAIIGFSIVHLFKFRGTSSPFFALFILLVSSPYFTIPFVIFFTWNARRAAKRILLKPSENQLYYLSPLLPALFAFFLCLVLLFIYSPTSDPGSSPTGLLIFLIVPVYFVVLYLLGVIELYVIKQQIRRLLKK